MEGKNLNGCVKGPAGIELTTPTEGMGHSPSYLTELLVEFLTFTLRHLKAKVAGSLTNLATVLPQRRYQCPFSLDNPASILVSSGRLKVSADDLRKLPADS